MSELPGTDELPRVAEGYDPSRVEEAFAAFADRVRDLEEVADELRAELRSLRAERAAPRGAPRARADDEHWPVEPAGGVSPEWVASVPAPLVRGNPVPRVVLEGVFLLLVALFAGLADLSVTWIVLLMAAAWALVVVGEWAAAAKRARWRLDEIAPPLAEPAAETTGPWDMPVVEATVVDPGPDPESQTVVTKLPSEPDEHDGDETPAAPPAKRRLRLRRRRTAETGAADPWEA
jgi:hypothetical protein